jgi:hypothetical protein
MQEREQVIKIAVAPFIGSLNIPFGELRPHQNGSANQCRYIAAETPGPDYLACGNETLPGESWCGHCRELVFNRGQNITDADRDRRSAQAMKNNRPSFVRSDIDVADEAA